MLSAQTACAATSHLEHTTPVARGLARQTLLLAMNACRGYSTNGDPRTRKGHSAVLAAGYCGCRLPGCPHACCGVWPLVWLLEPHHRTLGHPS